jgi:hypothetical protein
MSDSSEPGVVERADVLGRGLLHIDFESSGRANE